MLLSRQEDSIDRRCAIRGIFGTRLLTQSQQAHRCVTSRSTWASASRRYTAGDDRSESTRDRTWLTSAERAELAAARRQIRELESELAIHGKTSELLKGPQAQKEIRSR